MIMSKATNEVLERWNFSIETDSEVVEKGYYNLHFKFDIVLLHNFIFILIFLIWFDSSVSREKSDKEIMREIQAIMRQIASSITYLPCLDEPCKKSLYNQYPPHFKSANHVPITGFRVLFFFFYFLEQSCFVFLVEGVFDVLAYTDKDVAVPFTWVESDPKLIANPQMVKLHSFDTKVTIAQVIFVKLFIARFLLSYSMGFLGYMQIHKIDTLVSYKNDEWDEQ